MLVPMPGGITKQLVDRDVFILLELLLPDVQALLGGLTPVELVTRVR